MKECEQRGRKTKRDKSGLTSDHICPLCAQSHVQTVIDLTKSAPSWHQDEDAGPATYSHSCVVLFYTLLSSAWLTVYH